ncbi:glycosyltransferase involved in cell wall biosynthesis [Winogradskyella epiphytica]|uniref:Glycosyltransferase involved in cell wall biosynthesis n=1 Tax=Winogradskyella epiphytica TaxID=262005 RepID=A0A2V4WYG9_9FLAO|nr:glycosyltransferase [Winogradskyella epiphytica]PYE82706.1 glycosyltransferase involved in cell wall biosynthesis [Winogradskyella epiphytica]GGW53099.1 hypothetical protein GCM10008085_00120 [Winogradskyella epiphytica]
MSKKNILFLINNLGGGGAEKVLVNLVNHMDYNKYNITLRTLVNEGENKRFLSNTINYEYIFKKSFKGLNYLHLLPSNYIYKKVAYGTFDVIIVYLHGVLTKIVANAPASQNTIAYLHANMQNSPFIKSFSNQKQIVACFKSYNAIVSVSKSVEESFKAVSGINENLHVIYNTFDVKGIVEKSKEPLNHSDVIIGEADNKILNLITVGKLTAVKGYERLIKVIKKLRDYDIKVNLSIVGEGEQRSLLEQYIKKHQLENSISLLGFQSNPYKYIVNSDLFVCSSYSEGFSSVVVESIILGVPVITTDCAGMSEIVGEENEYGIIVDNNEESLYRGLKKMILERDLITSYSIKAKERAKYFSTEKGVLDVEKLIDRILNG